MAFIYVITNDINNKQYVGKTSRSLEERFGEHCRDRTRPRCENRPLYKAMNKYGVEHFDIELLEECDISIAEEREQYWIKKLNTYGSTGYNATRGGDSKHYYNYELLVQRYLELKNQKAVAMEFGCDVTVVRTALKEFHITSFPTYIASKSNKPVYMLDKNSEEILQSFSSTMEAERYLNKKGGHRHINEVCQGKRKTAYGYKWEYQNN
jgi:hypothetical protein